jgi:hypothetical protein
MTATVFDVARGAKEFTASALEPATEVVQGESLHTKWQLPPTVTIPVPPGAGDRKQQWPCSCTLTRQTACTGMALETGNHLACMLEVGHMAGASMHGSTPVCMAQETTGTSCRRPFARWLSSMRRLWRRGAGHTASLTAGRPRSGPSRQRSTSPAGDLLPCLASHSACCQADGCQRIPLQGSHATRACVQGGLPPEPTEVARRMLWQDDQRVLVRGL